MIKNLTIFDKYTETENNATKALIDLLRHSEVLLTELFINQFLGINQLNQGAVLSRSYDIQVGRQLTHKSGIGCVIAISDESKNKENKQVKTQREKETIPDALIQLNNVTLLVEAKIGGGKVDTQQLKDHQKKFAQDEVILAPIFVSWQKIHAFFEDIVSSNQPWNELTQFLLQQFLAYCEHMGFTYVKKESYILTHFINRPRVLEVLMEADKYLKSFSDVHRNEPITDCFGYTIIKDRSEDHLSTTRKFFTSTLFNKGTYVLHLLAEEKATELQSQVDSVFKGNQKTNKNAPREVHIHMDLVHEFAQIKPYIDIAYQDRRQSIGG
ncbi:hypothetical protein P9G84_10135 [Brevibacillus centrosporus]|uniref:hypothetical protein n=1 Tax=Brevibacillus centrosporus TaxID=54910 RepID=UPI001143162E|nr:hypothetical protein [Brevibacillus centrosporus]MEC2129326.1 hypothetical protein [Brevibacillus centrosporus]GED33492.1 hypothetical protein BCE02nite_46330 [Brevibacillus centrosporus]